MGKSNAERQKEYRNRKRNAQSNVTRVTEGVTVAVTGSLSTTDDSRDPENDNTVLIEDFGGDNCQCKHCQSMRENRSGKKVNHGPWLPADKLPFNTVNRVTLPGDPDYVAGKPQAL